MGKEGGQRLAAPYIGSMENSTVYEPLVPPEGYKRGNIIVGKVEGHDSDKSGWDFTYYDCPEHQDIKDGDWHLSTKLVGIEWGDEYFVYRVRAGFVHEHYRSDGSIESQSFTDKDSDLIQDPKAWAEREWWENGKLRSRTKGLLVNTIYLVKPLEEVLDDFEGTLVTCQHFTSTGILQGEFAYRMREGRVYSCIEEYDEKGKLEYFSSEDLIFSEAAPENTPSYFRYQDGKLLYASYRVVRGGESVRHRTDGPAIIDNRNPEDKRERYFLEGAEYTKDEWEKKVGRA